MSSNMPNQIEMSAIEDNIIKDIKNLLNVNTDKIIRDIRTLFESDEKDQLATRWTSKDLQCF